MNFKRSFQMYSCFIYQTIRMCYKLSIFATARRGATGLSERSVAECKKFLHKPSHRFWTSSASFGLVDKKGHNLSCKQQRIGVLQSMVFKSYQRVVFASHRTSAKEIVGV